MATSEITAADVDVDYLDSAAWDERSLDRMRWLRRNAPIYWASQCDLWVVSKYEDIVALVHES